MIVTLKDITTKITKGTTPTSIGCKFEKSGINFIKSESLVDGKTIDKSKFAFISERTHERLKRSQIEENDILFSMAGMFLGKTGIATAEVVPANTNQAVAIIRVDDTKANYEYVYYYLNQKSVIHTINTTSAQSAQPNINLKQIGKIKINLPDRKKQDQIVSLLSAIDLKISNNVEINDNLQQQAQALFKSWFLNYEPWDGTAPNSWLHGKLGDYANIKRGGSPRPIQEYLSDSGLRWLKISDVTGLQTPFIIDIKDHIIEEGLKKTVFLKAGSLVLSNSATPGIPKILDVDSCIHDGWLYFPESRFSNEYLYLYFKYIRQQLVNLSNGSVFNNLKTDILKGYPTILPDEETLQRFDGIIKPMFLQMQNLTRESHDLMDLRDTILPRLMSGELDVSGI